MDGMTRTNTLSQCRVRHYHECGQTRENVTCEGVLFTHLLERSNIFRNRSFTLFKNDRHLRERFDSVAVSESISSAMTNLSYTGLTVFALTFQQISTLEKTTCRQCSILSSLMS